LAVKGGMIVSAFIVMGVPGENVESLRDTLKLLRKLARIGVHEVSITTFTALPGSEFFYELLGEGKIELNDQFFRDLLRMSDLLSAYSWLTDVSDKQLNKFRLLGFFEFFFLSFSLRPWRIFRSLWNLITDKQETKVEKLAHEKLADGIKIAKKPFMRKTYSTS
jgi:radical SAM superfamily enzyme YgiQ (UPF0313 family)